MSSKSFAAGVDQASEWNQDLESLECLMAWVNRPKTGNTNRTGKKGCKKCRKAYNEVQKREQKKEQMKEQMKV